MAVNHAVSDLVAVLKNGQRAKRESVITESSNIRQRLLDILKDEGFIEGYQEIQSESGFKKLEVALKYYSAGAVIKDIRVISKPGRRVYCAANDIPVVYNGLGVVVLSTSKGIVADHKARELNVGGELLLEIF